MFVLIIQDGFIVSGRSKFDDTTKKKTKQLTTWLHPFSMEHDTKQHESEWCHQESVAANRNSVGHQLKPTRILWAPNKTYKNSVGTN